MPLYLHPDCEWTTSHAPLRDEYVSTRLPADTPSPFCQLLFFNSSMSTHCGKLARSTAFNHLFCASSVHASRTSMAALDSVLLYSSSCQHSLSLSTSPAQLLCAHFPHRHFPVWMPPLCSQRCLFGQPDGGECICDDGYWGDECQYVCPAGPGGVCSGHGICGPDGACICQLNWQGDDLCSSCTDGQGGADCSFTKPTIPPDLRNMLCEVSSGNVKNFRGYTFSVQRTATFYLVKTEHLQIWVQQLSCAHGSLCVVKAFINYHNRNVTFLLSNQDDSTTRLSAMHHNGTQLSSMRTYIHLRDACHLYVRMRFQHKYEVRLYAIGLAVSVTQYQQALSIVIAFARSYCCGRTLEGACGACGKCTATELNADSCPLGGSGGPAPGTLEIVDSDTSETIAEKINNILVPSSMNSDLVPGTLIPSYLLDGLGSGQCSCFNDSSASARDVLLFTERYTTIELLIRTCANMICYGTVLSYIDNLGEGRTLALLHQSTVQLVQGSEVICDTHVSLPHLTWAFVSIIMDHDAGRGYIFIYQSQTLLIARDWRFTAIHNRGDMGLGRWQPSTDGSTIDIVDRFSGCIDQFRIWHRNFGPFEIPNHWNVSLTGGEPDLIYLWKFDELSGNVSYDEVSRKEMLIPMKPFKSPDMYLSDAPIPYIAPAPLILFDLHTTMRRRKRRRRDLSSLSISSILDFCDLLFNKGDLAQSCSQLGDSYRRLFNYDCVVDVYTSDSHDAAVPSVVAFSDSCQQLLELSTWPAQDLCVHFDTSANFPIWIGSACDTPCYFGVKDPLNSSICNCEYGYWNVSCDCECPGGATNPCFGRGRCNINTGQCDCDINWRGSNDCSVCSAGWHGDDCSVVFAPKSASIRGWLSGTAQLRTLSGITTKVVSTGELLLFALQPFIVVQAKLVRCHAYFSCVKYVGVQIGDAQHGHAQFSVHVTKSLQLSVTLNDVGITLDRTLYFHGFVVQRLSIDEVGFDVGLNVRLILRAQRRNVHCSVQLERSLLSLTTGVLSGRESSTIADATFYIVGLPHQPSSLCKLHTPQVAQMQTVPGSLALNITVPPLTSTPSAASLSSAAIHTYVKRWTMDACDRVIRYPSAADEAQLDAGYALSFNRSSAYSKSSTSIIGENVTIEMFVKTATTGGGGGGVLFSYANEYVFVVFSAENGQLKVFYRNVIKATNLILPDDVWCKIVLVYEGTTGVLDFYLFGLDNTPVRHLLLLPSGVFSGGGSLAIGEWQPPSNGVSYDSLPSFIGLIDNFMVWTLKIDATLIKDVWNISLSDRKALLSAAWLFDEGHSVDTYDLLAGQALNMLGKPWNTPHWEASQAPAIEPWVTSALVLRCRDASLTVEATRTCNELRDKLVCNVSTAERDMYTLFCQQEYCLGGGIEAAQSVMYDLADACQTDNALWPAREHCDTVERKADCVQTCLFGKLTNSVCMCEHGYAGDNCTLLCPGGAADPCSNHGLCNASGHCECKYNWAGESCGVCAPQWHGIDCSILKLAASNNTSAFISSTAAIQTFDGVHFRLSTQLSSILDVFVFGGVQIQAQLLPCPMGSCLVAIAVALNKSIVSVHAEENGWPLVYVDETRIKHALTTINVGNGLQVSITSRHHVQVHTVLPPISCIIHVMQRYMHLTMETNHSVYSTADGILGSYDGVADNDFPFYNDNLTSTEVIRSIVSANEVSINSSLFYRGNISYVHQLTSAGYALSFDDTSATSAPLKFYYPVEGRIRRAMISNDVTVSLLMKPTTGGGVVFSYGHENSLALINRNNITLQCKETLFVTHSESSMGNWQQVLLVYEHEESLFHFYHFTQTGSLSYQVFQAPDCADFMSSGGRITLGSWQPSPQSGVHMLDPFRGYIDEFSVWQGRLPHSAIFQAHNARVNPAAFQDKLLILYRFSSGAGIDVQQPMSTDAAFILPQSPWQRPTWVESTLSLSQLPIHTQPHYTQQNQVSYQETKEICLAYFIGLVCDNVDGSVIEHFLDLCLAAGLDTMEVQNLYYVIASFAQLCPNARICELSNKRPAWLDDQCAGCVYGTPKAGNCYCLKGYWGDKCTEICPGGPANPCSGHGDCTSDGSCVCQPHYTGIACQTHQCNAGWLGETCSILPSSEKNTGSNRVGQLRSHGLVTMFDGTVLQLVDTGLYDMYSDSALQIWARLSHCLTDVLCFDAVMLASADNYVLFNRSSTTVNGFVAWMHTGILQVTATAVTGGLVLKQTAPSTLLVTSSSSQTLVDIQVFSSTLQLTVTAAKDTKVSGLLTPCNTVLAIQLSSCMGADSCVDNVNSLGSCIVPLSSTSVNNYASSFIKENNHFSQLSGQSFTVIKLGSAICLDSSQLCVDQLTALPADSFTIEVHVHPSAYGGVLLSYATPTGDAVMLVLKELGMELHYNSALVGIGGIIELNVWSEISLHWDNPTSLLELYLISSLGVATVSAIRLPATTFSPGGALCIGAPSSGSAFGVFIGCIDELRVWTRPHTPSVVHQNWRVAVTRQSPDLALYWDFSDGFGNMATELIHNSHLHTTTGTNTPSWIAIDRQLKEQAGITKSNYVMTSSVELTMAACVIEPTDEGTACYSYGSGLRSSYVTQCIFDAGSKIAANQYTLLCSRLDSKQIDIPREHGCIFGTSSSIGSCICHHGFWGTLCSDYCPTSALGRVCGGHGVCLQDNGHCACHARWVGTSLSLDAYYPRPTAVLYACDHCTDGWHGTDCSTALAIGGVPTAVIADGYFITFDGAMLEALLPGAYQALTTHDMSLQVMFYPCVEILRCRDLREVAIRSPSLQLSVQQQHNSELLVYIHKKNQWQMLSHEASRKILNVSITWNNPAVFHIHIANIKVLITSVSGKLFCGIQVATGTTVVEGFLGNANGNWTDDLNFGVDYGNREISAALDSEVIKDTLSTNYTGLNMKRLYAVQQSHLQSDLINMTSAGYMLRLNDSSILFDRMNIVESLSEFAVMFWLKVDLVSPLIEATTIMTLSMEPADFHLQIIKGQWHLALGITTSTGISIEWGVWLHITVSWKSEGGQLALQVRRAGRNAANSVTRGMFENLDMRLKAVELHANDGVAIDIDYFLIWNRRLSFSHVESIWMTYDDVNHDGLLAAVLFDSAQIFMTIYETIYRKVYGNFNLSQSLWLPSEAPVAPQPSPSILPIDTPIEVLTTCLNATYDALLRQHCSELGEAALQFFLEACLRDVMRYDENAVAMATRHAVAFYCQSKLELNECLFIGVLDFCLVDRKFAWWAWLLIAIAVVTAISIILCIIIFLAARKRGGGQHVDKICNVSDDDAETDIDSSTEPACAVSEYAIPLREMKLDDQGNRSPSQMSVTTLWQNLRSKRAPSDDEMVKHQSLSRTHSAASIELRGIPNKWSSRIAPSDLTPPSTPRSRPASRASTDLLEFAAANRFSENHTIHSDESNIGSSNELERTPDSYDGYATPISGDNVTESQGSMSSKTAMEKLKQFLAGDATPMSEFNWKDHADDVRANSRASTILLDDDDGKSIRAGSPVTAVSASPSMDRASTPTEIGDSPRGMAGTPRLTRAKPTRALSPTRRTASTPKWGYLSRQSSNVSQASSDYTITPMSRHGVPLTRNENDVYKGMPLLDGNNDDSHA